MNWKIIFLFFTVVLALGSCKDKPQNLADIEGDWYYTCPMHPTVRSGTPGACPVCNMSLIKVEKKVESHEGHKGNFITLDKRQQLLAGIKTDTVKNQIIIPASRILGTVAIDEDEVVTVSSRVKGRIDKLFVKTSGTYVQKGNAIYSIYSEKLFADEKEFLALSENKKRGGNSSQLADELLTASEYKLLLWGLTENQISEIEKGKTAAPQMTFYSQGEGYVTDVLVREGAYVEEGTTLIKLAKLKSVWIDAQLYTNDKLNGTNSFLVLSESSPEEIYKGELVFLNPSVMEDRKIQLLRLKVDNSKGGLIPGMWVYVIPGNQGKPALAIPKSAVLPENQQIVWVKSGENTFEQRVVETGTTDKHWMEILSGINEGDLVVTSGAYLLGSEFKLKGEAGIKHAH